MARSADDTGECNNLAGTNADSVSAEGNTTQASKLPQKRGGRANMM